MKAIFAAKVIGVVVLAVLIGVGGWQAGWWLEGKNVDKRVQIQNRNKGVQTAWMDEARNAVVDYQLVDPSNTAARGALRTKACDLIYRLSDSYLQPDLESFQEKQCR